MDGRHTAWRLLDYWNNLEFTLSCGNKNYPNRMRTRKVDGFRDDSINGVSYHHLRFVRSSKAGKGVGKFNSGNKGKLQVCPGWRLAAWKSVVHELKVGLSV